MRVMAFSSAATRLFVQPFVWADIKRNIQRPCYCLLWGEPPMTIHRWPVDSAHKGSVTQKELERHDVLMVHGQFQRAMKNLNLISRIRDVTVKSSCHFLNQGLGDIMNADIGGYYIACRNISAQQEDVLFCGNIVKTIRTWICRDIEIVLSIG